MHFNGVISLMVGKTGFEPATPWSQTRCSTKLSHFPKDGALEGIRTPDLLVRSQTLYPTELRAQNHLEFNLIKWWLQVESNHRHKDFQSFALPTELWSQNKWRFRRDLNPRSFAWQANVITTTPRNHGCGSWIWTNDLWVMSPTSYRAAPSRDKYKQVAEERDSNPCAAFATSRFSRPVPSTRLGYSSTNGA